MKGIYSCARGRGENPGSGLRGNESCLSFSKTIKKYICYSHCTELKLVFQLNGSFILYKCSCSFSQLRARLLPMNHADLSGLSMITSPNNTLPGVRSNRLYMPYSPLLEGVGSQLRYCRHFHFFE
jgi:hypothetical protein